ESDAEALERLKEVPGGTEMAPAARWQNRSAATVKDMLDYSPGVSVAMRNGAEAARLSIRGSGLARAFQGRGLLLTQDGIPINTADGSFDFQELDPWLYRRVEVLRGANGMEQGASTLGGAVQFVTPVAEGGERIAAVEGGSFETAHALAAAGVRGEKVDAYVAATRFHQQGFRAQNEQNSARASGNVGVRWSPQAETRFFANVADTHAEIPGSLTFLQLRANPAQGRGINIAGDYSRNLSIGSVAARTVWKAGQDEASVLVFGKYRGLANPATVYIASGDVESGVRAQWVRKRGDARATMGANVYHGAVDEDRYANAGGTAGARIVFRNQTALTAESYGQVAYALAEGLEVMGGGQVTYAERNIKELFPTLSRQQADYWGFSPRVGMRYAVSPQAEVFGNLSGSFEPPTFSELSGGNAPGFSRLAAQRAQTAEMGLRGKRREMIWEVAVYHARLRNEFLNYRFPDGRTETVNARRSTHSGVEMGLTGVVARGLGFPDDALSVQGAYTLNYFRLAGDAQYGDHFLPGVGKHVVRAQLAYAVGRWQVAPNVEWLPSAVPVDTAGSVHAPGYALWGISAGYAPEGASWRVYVEGRNLANAREAATVNVVPDAFGADTPQFFPVEGRAVYGGLRLRW
ncbi:MAG: TonB-dependent receptor, partial [Rickettsiales bacterium]|nr:TonB-dependent receptor [Rickettsiales bacterium]